MKKYINLILVVFLMACTTEELHKEASNIIYVENDSMSEKIRKATLVVPSPRQYEWQKMEFLAFVHFGVNSFSGREWGTGNEDVKIFNPKECNPEQWVKIMKEAGMRGVVLTVKHHDGFCLWPSNYTRNSVKYSSWLDGKGDVLRMLSDACKKHGLKLGIYMSPADLNQMESKEGFYGNDSKPHKSIMPSKPEYCKNVTQVFEYDNLTDYDIYFMNQLHEVLTGYGEIFEVWFDGANPSSEVNQTYNYKAWYDLIRKLQPNAVIAVKGPDVRWAGWERGGTRESEWSVIPFKKHPSEGYDYNAFPRYNDPDLGSRKRIKDANYLNWFPAESITTTRNGWFYKNEQQIVRPVSTLLDIWYRSVGGNYVFMLNLNPDNRGLIPARDAYVLKELGRIIKNDFKTNLAAGAKVIASATDGIYKAKNLTDGREDTYWKAPDGVETPYLILELDEVKQFNRLVLQEYIKTHGQRIESYALDIWDAGTWQEINTGEVVGYKAIDRFSAVRTNKLRLRITASRIAPTLSFIGLYMGEEQVSNPQITRDKSGMVSIKCKTPDPVIYYTIDGTMPDAQSTRFYKSFKMENSGVVKAIAYIDENTKASDVIDVRFDICKRKWKVIKPIDGGSENAIDDNNTSYCHFSEKSGNYINQMAIDMGEIINISGFSYVPPEQNTDGIIEEYKLELSLNGKTWTTASSGIFDNIKNNPVRQEVKFEKIHPCQYIRLISVDETKKREAFSIAEFGVTVDNN